LKYIGKGHTIQEAHEVFVAPMIYDGTTDSILFEYWFEHSLLKAIPKYSVIILDNATFHRKSKLRLLAEQSDCEVLFLPPYSPDLNPTEVYPQRDNAKALNLQAW